MITAIEGAVTVDPQRIYVVGHSNGGFMSYRLACTRADRIAAIVSLAGATFATSAAGARVFGAGATLRNFFGGVHGCTRLSNCCLS